MFPHLPEFYFDRLHNHNDQDNLANIYVFVHHYPPYFVIITKNTIYTTNYYQ